MVMSVLMLCGAADGLLRLRVANTRGQWGLILFASGACLLMMLCYVVTLAVKSSPTPHETGFRRNQELIRAFLRQYGVLGTALCLFYLLIGFGLLWAGLLACYIVFLAHNDCGAVPMLSIGLACIGFSFVFVATSIWDLERYFPPKG